MMNQVITPGGARVDRDTGLIAEQPRGFVALDPMAPGGIAADIPKRPSWLAAISAGHKIKNAKGTEYPQASKNGEIYVHIEEGEGQGLITLLGAKQDNDYEHCFVTEPNARLTIAVAGNAEWIPNPLLPAGGEWDLSAIFSQRFVRRSASALQVYGDHTKLSEITFVEKISEVVRDGQTVIEKRMVPDHVDHYAGSERFAELLPTTKAETRMLWCNAMWSEQDRARMPFPDGIGWYSLRFTSRWSFRSLMGKLQEVCSLTGGQLRGLPFELHIAYMEVPGPDGKTRRIPVWKLGFNPPKMIELSSDNWGSVIGGALEEGRKLALIEAPRETLEHAARIFDVDLDTSEAIETLTNGSPRCDAAEWKARWFTFVKGSSLDSDEARDAFLRKVVGEHSLAAFLSRATDVDAAHLLGAAADEIGKRAGTESDEPLATQTQRNAVKETAARFKVSAVRVNELLVKYGAATPAEMHEADIKSLLMDMVTASLTPEAAPAPPQPVSAVEPEPAASAPTVEETRAALTKAAADKFITKEWGAEVEPMTTEEYAAFNAEGQPPVVEGEVLDPEPAGPNEIATYLRRVELASKLGVDLAPYEANTGDPRARLLLMSDRLQSEIYRVQAGGNEAPQQRLV